MAPKTGTLAMADLLANKQTTAADFGLDTIAEVFRRDLEAHNRIVNSIVQELADPTSDRLRLAGESGSLEMVEIDEFGRSRTQKPTAGNNVGFPLKLFTVSIGWTRKYFQQRSVRDVALVMQNTQIAHRKKVRLEIQRALFRSANYTFTDALVAPSVALPVKRLANADSMAISDGPNGETFDGATHQHYLANATLTAAALLSLVNTVAEHSTTGQVRVAISTTDETAVRALSGFTAYVDARLTLNTAANQPTEQLDFRRQNDRPIGVFGAAEVWVKPWAIANYALAYDVGAAEKPLAYRTRTGATDAGLVIAAELDDYPLHAQHMEAEFGFGVWGRVSAAVLYFAGGSYVDAV
jgi:hypothetical protein